MPRDKGARYTFPYVQLETTRGAFDAACLLHINKVDRTEERTEEEHQKIIKGLSVQSARRLLL